MDAGAGGRSLVGVARRLGGERGNVGRRDRLLRAVRPSPSANGLSRTGALGALERPDHPARSDHQERQHAGPDLPGGSRLDLSLPGRVPRIIQSRSAHLPEPIRATAWKAQVRLTRRYRRLMAAGKVAPKVVTAIARELIGFIWAIARMVEPKTA